MMIKMKSGMNKAFKAIPIEKPMAATKSMMKKLRVLQLPLVYCLKGTSRHHAMQRHGTAKTKIIGKTMSPRRMIPRLIAILKYQGLPPSEY